MAPSTRFQPCLFDRLLEDDSFAAGDARGQGSVSLTRYLAGIRRDLAWLLNTTAKPADHPVNEFPEASASVINFGFRDLSGERVTDQQADELARRVRAAIVAFEPRIIAETLVVRPEEREYNAPHNSLAFTIQADVWALPYPAALSLKTELDLVSGQFLLI